MKRISIFILFITLFSTFVFGQWHAANGPTGGQTNVLFNFKVEGAAVVYAGTPFGLFKSINSGSTWNPISSELAGKNISSITSFGTTLYVTNFSFTDADNFIISTFGVGLFKTTDGGNNLVQISNSGLTDQFAKTMKIILLL